MDKDIWLHINRIISEIKPKKLSLEGQNQNDILVSILFEIFTINIIFSSLTVIIQERDNGSWDCAHSAEDGE